jgi:hypothetical protein
MISACGLTPSGPPSGRYPVRRGPNLEPFRHVNLLDTTIMVGVTGFEPATSTSQT